MAKEAIKQPLIFKRSLTLLSIAEPIGEVKLIKDCVRVTCLSPRQKTALLNTTDWNGKLISYTEPWSMESTSSRQICLEHPTTQIASKRY